MSLHAAAPAVFPGTGARRAAELLAAELLSAGGASPHLAALPELPARGHHATLLGRAVAQLSELYAELTSYGWRLTQRPGADHQRAVQLLRADVDTLADVRGERAELHGEAPSPLKLEVLGPVSLAARLALPGGEKVLIDHGARRDLAESLASGVAGHVEHVRRTCASERLTVVLEETGYGRVRAGEVPTVSGYRAIRSLPRDEARAMVGVVVEALRTAGADEVLLDLGGPPAAEHAEDFRGRDSSRVDGFGISVPELRGVDWERVAELTESGAHWLAGLLRPAETSREALPQVRALAARLTEPWQALGMPASSLEAFTATSFSGDSRERPAALDEASALRTVARVRDAAEALTEQISS